MIRIFTLLFVVSGWAQAQWPDTIAKDSLCVYLITRGTSGKTAMIAERFNRYDRCASHVGIAIFDHGQLHVVHVTNESSTSGSALVESTFEDFTGVPDIEYWGIWRLESEADSIQSLRKILLSFDEPIDFDFDFDASDNRKLYCSEFCANVLMAWNPLFTFRMACVALDSFGASMLTRTHLEYWPVDFFQEDAGFSKIYEVFVPQ